MRFLLLPLLLLLSLFIGFGAVSPANAAEWRVASNDILHLKSSLKYVDKNRWDAAKNEAAKSKDPIIKKIIQWMYYKEGKASNFFEISRFIQENPEWPGQYSLRRRAENVVDSTISSDFLSRWFDKYPPLTAKGMQYFAEAKIAKGRKDSTSQKEIYTLLTQAWIDGNFSDQDERVFLKRHGKILSRENHHRRIDRLLWNGRIRQAQRILYKADSAHKKLFSARIKLQRNMSGLDKAIRSIPGNLVSNEGLLYDRIKWRERRRLHKGVQELLRLTPEKPEYPHKWWAAKHKQVRALILKKHYKKAYGLVAHHNMKKGADFAEAEWLAGWLALRFRNDPEKAYQHFYTLYHNVKYPISLARGAYWAGRAAEANKNKTIAKSWYNVAAKHNQTFYGQLALHNLGIKNPSNASTTISSSDKQSYRNNTIAKVSYILLKAGMHGNITRHLLTHAVTNAKTLGEKELVGNLALSFRRYELAVAAAKQGAKDGMLLANSGYPIISEVIGTPKERAFRLAIIRQESEFNKQAKSHAGARGYMQLMPRTARSVARELRVNYSLQKLTSNPSYNIKLGSHYLQKMLNKYDGAYVLAIASYNAGPGNVRKWQKKFGSPREQNSLNDVIDWIELIPFTETRNYVQRVMENMIVYNNILKATDTTVVELLG